MKNVHLLYFRALVCACALLILAACTPGSSRTGGGGIDSVINSGIDTQGGPQSTSSDGQTGSDQTKTPGMPGNGEGYGARALTSVARMTAPVATLQNLPPAPTDIPLIQWMDTDWSTRSGGMCEAGSILRMTLTAASEPDRALCILDDLEDKKYLTVRLDNQTYHYEVPWLGETHQMGIKARANDKGLMEEMTLEVYRDGEVSSALLYSNINGETRMRWLRLAPNKTLVGQTTDAVGKSLSDGTWTLKQMTHKGVHVTPTARYSLESRLEQKAQKLLMKGFAATGGLRAYSATLNTSLKISGAATIPTLRLGEGAAWIQRKDRFDDFFGLLAWLGNGMPIAPAPASQYVMDISNSLITPYEVTNEHLSLEWNRLGKPVQVIRVPSVPVEAIEPCMKKYPLFELKGDAVTLCRDADY